MKKFLPFLILVFLLSVIALATYNLNEEQQKSNINANLDGSNIHFVSQKIKLPQFSLPNLYDDNDKFSKRDLRGKYSIVNFFASWCLTCRLEHDVLMRLKSEGIIDIYGVAFNDISQNTKNYLKKSGNPFKKVGRDNEGLFQRLIGLKAVPETLIIDKQGNVVMRYQGNLQDFLIDDIKKFLARQK